MDLDFKDLVVSLPKSLRSRSFWGGLTRGRVLHVAAACSERTHDVHDANLESFLPANATFNLSHRATKGLNMYHNPSKVRC